MREVEFRGRRLDTGEWVYGYYYAEYPYQCFISDEERKKQEKHWIVWQEDMDWGLTRMVRAQVAPTTVGQYTRLKDKNGKKIYEGDIVPVYQIGRVVVEFTTIWGYGGEVIGNIHDNPELLE